MQAEVNRRRSRQKSGLARLGQLLNFTEDKSEWKGTKITFEVSKKGDKTEVRFSHLGLIPEYECFDVSSTRGALISTVVYEV